LAARATLAYIRNIHSENIRSDQPNPRALRAVAHPVRIELLALLRAEGPQTASRCAERLGLSPKVCSYHLQLLGKYGLIEETGEGKGRARPWRLATKGVSYVHRPGEDPAAASASDQLARTLLARDTRLVEEFIAARHELPENWRNVAAMLGDAVRLSPEQLGSLGHDLAAVLRRYAELSTRPAVGAHPVHIAVYAVPVDLASLAR
jgi:predicted ArsR family transcriptional regulator